MTLGDSAPDVSQPAWSVAGVVPVPEAASAPAPPRSDERFEARAELGGGGMGRVRLVHDRWLERLVAVKEPVTEADARRLWREAHITARLEHPGIVPIYDLGLGPDGTPWYAMRVVRGRSLAEILRARPGPEERMGLMRPLLAACEAVGFAHEQGIVHRDIKPDNLMIGAFGVMQVIDWGLALAPDVPDADQGSAGTLAYMAPEQARGEAVDARADVFSLGAVLFHVVAGHGPRSHVAADALREAARRGERAPLPAGVSSELAAIIVRATAVDPAARYPDAKALADDLARLLDGRRVLAHAYSSAELLRRLVKAWRVPLAVIGVALAVLAVVVVAGVARVQSERDQAEANLALSRVREAQRALEDERHGEAELLATLALASVDPIVDAEARGVLAAIGPLQPTREEVARLPCEPTALIADRALCRDRGSVSASRGGVRTFERALDNQTVVLIDEGRAVVVQDVAAITILDTDTGATIATHANPCRTPYGTRLEPAGDRRSALLWNQNCAVVVRREGLQLLPPRPCEGSGLSVLAASRDGERLAGACSDGTLALIDRGATPRRLEANFGTARRPPLLTAIAFAGRDVLIVGAADGTLERVAIEPTLARVRLPGQHGLVRRIAVGGDAALALVLADASAPLVLDLERRAALLRLPERALWSAIDLDALGVAHTASSATDTGMMLERWDLRGLLPRALSFPDGVTTVAWSPTGRVLAVGDGMTAVLVDDERRVLARHTWQDSIVKTLGFDGEGRLVAHGLGATRVVAFDPLAPRPDYHAPPSIWRRVAVLADGSAVVSNYQHQQFLLSPDRPAESLGTREIVDLVASADGRQLALNDQGGEILCATDFARRRELAPCGRARDASALAIDGAFVYALERHEIHRIARAAPSGDAHLVHRAPMGSLVSVAVNERFVAAGGRDGSVWLWRQGEAEPWAIVRSHRGRVDNLAFAPRGDMLVAGAWDGSASFIALPEVEAGAL